MKNRMNCRHCNLLASFAVALVATNNPTIALADAQPIKDVQVPISVDKDAIAILKDKSGNYFKILNQSLLKSGKWTSGFYIQNVNGGKITLLGGGSRDGTDGSCGKGTRREMLNLEKAADYDIDLTIKDVNTDKFLDIFTEFTEENCKTGEKYTITNIFYATDHGFVLGKGEQ